MFTDQPVTPVRLEVLLNVLERYSSGLKREVVYELLQPTPLLGGKSIAAKETIKAAQGLGLVVESSRVIKLDSDYDKKKSAKDNILRGMDKSVLSNSNLELHLSLFYSFYLGLNKEVYQYSKFDREKWANEFNEKVFNKQPQPNRFNVTKHTGLGRWFSYLGMGWYDSNDNFQANPYERLRRSLSDIFLDKLELKGDEFMEKLAEVCPELDGGDIFVRANKYKNYNVADKQCTLGLSHALVDLHEDRIINLVCPVDSHGWNIEFAEPTYDEFVEDNRITRIEYLRKECNGIS
jgi:hypothetical protein